MYVMNQLQMPQISVSPEATHTSPFWVLFWWEECESAPDTFLEQSKQACGQGWIQRLGPNNKWAPVKQARGHGLGGGAWGVGNFFFLALFPVFCLAVFRSTPFIPARRLRNPIHLCGDKQAGTGHSHVVRLPVSALSYAQLPLRRR